MDIRIIKGDIVEAPALGALEITENGYLVARDGIITGVYADLPREYAQLPVEDYGNALILQSFSDMHLHGPQFPMLGMGMDMELLEWLNHYVFPTEARFRDDDYAREIYRRLAQELVTSGTTRVCMFSSLHRRATMILMEELEAAGISGFVGKVNMDRNTLPVLTESTEESMSETLSWLAECEKFRNIKPILTPRFTPSCTDGLLAFLGNLARERGLPVQSHLSENRAEMEWVKRLHPDCDQYWQSYEKFGLWNPRTLMAHCVWSDEAERSAMKKAGVTVVHCPDSNVNLASGIAPVRAMLEEGVKVVLGSDIAAGDHISGFDNVAAAIRVSKLRCVLDETHPKPLSVAEGWYLGTSATAEFFGEKPGLAAGNRLNVMVVDDSALLHSDTMTVRERFERAVYRRQPDAIRAVYSGSRKL